MRDGECDDLYDFERELAHAASRCEISYGAMGATGFLYESTKDRLRWSNLSPKRWVHIVMEIGHYIVMDEEKWDKAKVGAKKSTADGMAAALVAAFGDGKEQ